MVHDFRVFSRASSLRLLAQLMAAALLFVLSTSPAAASRGDRKTISAICDHAAAYGAQRHGAPLEVLRALTRTETGRSIDGALAPWPWTVNMEGAGHWFETRDEALAFVKARQADGARSFDVGCFQINYRWHGEAFASLEDMFDPRRNASYAAKFLSDLSAETGDWRKAVGFYHSRTPSLAAKYSARFERIFAALSPAPQLVAISGQERRQGADARPSPNQTESEPPAEISTSAAAIGSPRHGSAATRGGVQLTLFTQSAGGLLRRARPLFE